MSNFLSRLQRVLPPLILLLAVWLVYHRAVDFSFVDWDDNVHIYNNSAIMRAGGPNILHFWTQPHEKLFIPIPFTAWSFIAEHARTGKLTFNSDASQAQLAARLDPRPFHMANLLVHVLSVLLVWLIARNWLTTRHATASTSMSTATNTSLAHENHTGTFIAWSAAAGALLFAVHPLQVEPVAWATGLKDLLGGFFSFLSLWLYLQSQQNEACARRWLTGATVAFVAALLSKPSAAAVPLMAWCLTATLPPSQPETKARRAGHMTLLFWLLMAALLAVAMRIYIQPAGQDRGDVAVPLRLYVAGDAIAFYLAKLVCPSSLTIIYDRRPDAIFQHWWGYTTWLLPTALAYVAWRLRSRCTWLLSALGVFISALLPSSGLVPFDFQAFSTVADRYAYPALLGAALALSAVIYKCLAQSQARTTRTLIAALCVMWLVALGVLSLRQTVVWRDSHTLWTHVLSVNPKNSFAYINLGVALQEGGQQEKARNYFEHAITLSPNDSRHWSAYNDLGTYYLYAKQPEQARACFERALQLKPLQAPVLTNLGDSFAAQQKWPRAIAAYEKALRVDNRFERARLQLANTFQAIGQRHEAIVQYQRILETSPETAEAHYNLALLLPVGTESLHHFQSAVSLAPHDAQFHNGLALALARNGRIDLALPQWKAAVRIDPSFTDAHFNLGAAYAAQGNTAQAITQWREVLRLQPGHAAARRALQKILNPIH